MVISQKYKVVDLEKGTLARNVFTDEGIYQDELEKIFGRAWLMIAHDSLLPNPNDFFLSYMGRNMYTKGTGTELEKRTRSKNKHLSVNGHSIIVTVVDEEELPFPKGTATGRGLPVWESFTKATLPEVERRLGRSRSRLLSGPYFFPNAFLGLRFALPRGPLSSELWNFTMWDKDAPEEVIRDTRLQMEQKDNFSGVHEQDDTDNWRQMTDSGRYTTGRKYLSDLSLGVGHATSSDPQWIGMVAEKFISESNQRQYYARWQEFMNADSWKDIHIDPITAKFEGTATKNG